MSITYPSGRVVDYGRGTNGEVQQVRTSPDAVSSPTELVLWAAYTPFGPRYITAFANDLRESREYDADGRITGYGIEDQSLGQDLIRRGLQYQSIRKGWHGSRLGWAECGAMGHGAAYRRPPITAVVRCWHL
ncbi:hypothetical protein [Mesorhizobium sp. WSM3876]|uniref:hypothetical protein n=1 Tax=Mesorhizobium sp. WSM3876 TaxID=422277 RepID=UPI000BAEF366|nr:hypothetical protein [Mesorhizobium sp. WSM3876]PBB88377.1 hypothetical protein CK216_01175 [Mesorhizobium sp. WSM3876]